MDTGQGHKSQVKAELNHKSYAERYKVKGNTRHTCYVCTLYWALFIIVTWFFAHYFIWIIRCRKIESIGSPETQVFLFLAWHLFHTTGTETRLRLIDNNFWYFN